MKTTASKSIIQGCASSIAANTLSSSNVSSLTKKQPTKIACTTKSAGQVNTAKIQLPESTQTRQHIANESNKSIALTVNFVIRSNITENFSILISLISIDIPYVKALSIVFTRCVMKCSLNCPIHEQHPCKIENYK